jgi:hypothetical protein
MKQFVKEWWYPTLISLLFIATVYRCEQEREMRDLCRECEKRGQYLDGMRDALILNK